MIPDLAALVVSPSNSAGQVLDKVREYLQAGVQLVWIIDPTAGEVHVFHARNLSVVTCFQIGDALRAESLVPGFELPLATLYGEGEGQGQVIGRRAAGGGCNSRLLLSLCYRSLDRNSVRLSRRNGYFTFDTGWSG